MTISQVTVAAGASQRTALGSLLTAGGFTAIETTSSFTNGFGNASTVADVYKSPGANNVSGTDWYLYVCEWTVSSNRYLALAVSEGYDTTAHGPIRPAPVGQGAVVPNADGSVAGSTPSTLSQLCVPSVSWVHATGVTTYIDITPDRVIHRAGLYAGLGIKTLGALDPRMPLLTAIISTGWGSASSTYGATTREPGQTLASTYNWGAQIPTSSIVQARLINPFGDGLSNEQYTGRAISSPVWIAGSRFGVNMVSALRALLRDVRGLGRTTVAGDTLTELDDQGVTRNYVAISTNGIVVPA